MPKPSADQDEIVEVVLHEFKNGQLKTGAGTKVTSRKQAIAIALNEAGESSQEATAENRRTLERTEAKERQSVRSK